MRKMVDLREWENEVLGKFRMFQAMNFGRTLVVSFLLLPSVLGVKTMGEGGVTKYKWKEKEETFH